MSSRPLTLYYVDGFCLYPWYQVCTSMHGHPPSILRVFNQGACEQYLDGQNSGRIRADLGEAAQPGMPGQNVRVYLGRPWHDLKFHRFFFRETEVMTFLSGAANANQEMTATPSLSLSIRNWRLERLCLTSPDREPHLQPLRTG